jgi:hypothetical protein
MRREMIAAKIANGLKILGGGYGGGWFVGTFDRYENKPEAVIIANHFVQALRRYCGKNFGKDFKLQVSKTWEHHKSGRLHVNLIMAPWRYIPFEWLFREWHILGGGVKCWITRVGEQIGKEVSKSYADVARYISKIDQMCTIGRGVSYSKGWPELPGPVKVPRRGEISWRFVGNYVDEAIVHWYETELGHWEEVGAGEYAKAGREVCDCFEFQDRTGLFIAKAMMKKFRDSQMIEADVRSP